MLFRLGFSSFSPNDLQNNTNKVVKEAKLNELGEYDNKGGSPGYEETTGPIRAIRKRDVKEQSPANISYKERPMYEKSTGSNPMPTGADRGIYQQEDANRPDRDLEARTYTGATGMTRTTHEETKMDNKERINEALDCILEDNLSEMKDNLFTALQEKTMEKLEEKKKIISANYFAQ